jgi:hypothetical protein
VQGDDETLMSADQSALVVAVVNALTEHSLRSRRRPRPGCTHRDHPIPPVSDIKAVQGLVESKPVGWEPGVAGEVVAARLLDLFEAAAGRTSRCRPGQDAYIRIWQ